MSDVLPSDEQLAEFHAFLRYDIVRIDKAYDDTFGMGYFDGFYEEDPDTGEERDIVLDDAMKRRYQLALAREWVAKLSVMCPRAVVRVFRGSASKTTFIRESPVEVSDDEIWEALDAFDEDWDADLCPNAFSAVFEEEPARRLSGRPSTRRRLPRRRRR